MGKYISVKVVDVDTHNTVKNDDGESMYKVTYPDGYVSTVPCRIFEKNYIRISDSDLKFINNYE